MMAESGSELAAAKKAIRSMLDENPRPTQKQIAAATGLTQSYVAKINGCTFKRINAGIRKVLEYSKLQPAERASAEARARGLADRISTGAGRLAARDADLAEAVADFIDRVSRSGPA